jgi:hypothetical protein
MRAYPSVILIIYVCPFKIKLEKAKRFYNDFWRPCKCVVLRIISIKSSTHRQDKPFIYDHER